MNVVNLTARRKCGKEQTTHAQILKGKDQKKGDNMAFIEVKDESGVSFLINVDDIEYVANDKDQTRIAHRTTGSVEILRRIITTPFDEIRDQLTTDGQKTAYHKGWEDGANAAAEHLRLCNEEKSQKVELSTVERMIEITKTEIEALQKPIMRDFDDYHKGMFEGLAQALNIIERWEG